MIYAHDLNFNLKYMYFVIPPKIHRGKIRLLMVTIHDELFQYEHLEVNFKDMDLRE